MPAIDKKKVIYLFRNNLRLRDNPSLELAVNMADELLPVFIFDSRLSGSNTQQWGPHRKGFTLKTLDLFKAQLKELGSDILVLTGIPDGLITGLLEKWDADLIITSKEPGWYEQDTDRLLSKRIELIPVDDQSLVASEHLPFPFEKLPLSFTSFRKKLEPSMDPRSAGSGIKGFPTFPGEVNCKSISIKAEYSPDPRSAFPFQPGEECALQHLQNYIWQTRLIRSYKDTRNGMVGMQYSSKFSPYLSLGNLSPVQIWQEIRRHEQEFEANESTYWLKFELLWREFFRHTAYRHGKHMFRSSGIRGFRQEITGGEEEFRSWKEGRTGVDLVDACMKELNQTGFISNRGRQNAASFLVHDLGVDWRKGASYFESQLIDFDVSSNWGNWMYIAGSGNSQDPRRFNIEKQAEIYDPNEEFRKLWLG